MHRRIDTEATVGHKTIVLIFDIHDERNNSVCHLDGCESGVVFVPTDVNGNIVILRKDMKAIRIVTKD